MTPYATLMVRPADGDLRIRKAFHALAEGQHPDRNGAAGVLGPRWYEITAAYGLIKTKTLRAAWKAMQSLQARRCKSCDGYGVVGYKVRLCEKCDGEGRMR